MTASHLLGEEEKTGGPYFYKPLGSQQIAALTLAASTGLTVPAGATFCAISIDTANVRWRDDGTAVTTSTGMRKIFGTDPFWYYGDLNAIVFIAESGSPVLNVSYYR